MVDIMPRVPAHQLWLVWLVTAVAVLIAKPWGVFSWDEWLVLVAPLLLIYPAVHRRHVLIIGLGASSLAWIALGDRSGGWPELVCLWGILAAGTVVGFTIVRGSRGEQSPPSVVKHPQTNGDPFFDALNRELCRARREEGSFAVLSVDRQAGHSDASLGCVCELLDAELRAYADIAHVGERILALVPEVGGGQQAPLLQRLRARAESTDCGEIRVGLARFPQDAVCAEDLIDTADRKRLVKGLSRLSSAGNVCAQSQVLS